MRTIFKHLIGAVMLLIVFQACKKETSPVTSFTASQGNCIGVVRLAVEQGSNVENYTYERKNPQTNRVDAFKFEGFLAKTDYPRQSVHNVRYLRYACREIAHPDFASPRLTRGRL